MGAFSIWHWLIVLAVVLVLFGGGGKVSRLMGDFGKGLKNFKKSMKEDEDESGDKKEIGEDATPKTSEPEKADADKDKADKDKADKDKADKDKAANG